MSGDLPQLVALRAAAEELDGRPEIHEDAEQPPSTSQASTSIDISIENAVASLGFDSDFNPRSSRRNSRRARRLPRPRPLGDPSWSIELLLSILDRSAAPAAQQQWIFGLVTFTVIMSVLTAFSADRVMLAFVFFVCFAAVAVGVILILWLVDIPVGNDNMQAVAGLISECSGAYVSTMFGSIYKFLVPMMLLIFLFYLFHCPLGESLAAAVAFALGACCCSVAGIANIWVCTRANVRVARSACVLSVEGTVLAASRSGTIIGIIINVLCLLSIAFLLTVYNVLLEPDVTKVPKMLLGLCLGSSYVALFAQVGGVTFSRGAQLSVEHCRRFGHAVPQDAHNPVIPACLAGQIVGDCCARGADLFQSLSCGVTVAMLLAAGFAESMSMSKIDGTNFVLFPLAMSTVNLVITVTSAMLLKVIPSTPIAFGSHIGAINLFVLFRRGYVLSLSICILFFVVTSWSMLYMVHAIDGWWSFASCGVVGMLSAYFAMLSMKYYFSDLEGRTQQTNESHVPLSTSVLRRDNAAIALICGTILMAFHFGRQVNADDIKPDAVEKAGLFGTALAVTGSLSNLSYCLGMEVFVALVGNAAGIAELCPDYPEEGRAALKLIGEYESPLRIFNKGFAVTSGSLVSFLLFLGLLHVTNEQGDTRINIDISRPEVFIGGTVGVMMVFTLSAAIEQAVASIAQKFTAEVQKHFSDVAEMSANYASPERRADYGCFVTVMTQAAVRHLLKPVLLAAAPPLVISIGILGATSPAGHEDPHWKPSLHAKAVISYLGCSTMTAIIQSCAMSGTAAGESSFQKLLDPQAPGDTGQPSTSTDTVACDIVKSAVGPSLRVLVKMSTTLVLLWMAAFPHLPPGDDDT